jgi:hypothetical protein
MELDRAPGESDYLPNTRKFVQLQTGKALKLGTNINRSCTIWARSAMSLLTKNFDDYEDVAYLCQSNYKIF